MPLSKKGQKIKAAMRRQYGTRKGDRVFYASANKGRIQGVRIGRGRKGRRG
jgi:hypothetical protein